MKKYYCPQCANSLKKSSKYSITFAKSHIQCWRCRVCGFRTCRPEDFVNPPKYIPMRYVIVWRDHKRSQFWKMFYSYYNADQFRKKEFCKPYPAIYVLEKESLKACG